MKNFIFTFVVGLLATLPLFGDIPPFEKVYVDSSELVTFHDGTYYFDAYGNSTKINKLLCDANGSYFLVVYYQCPICNRCWTTKPDEGYDCPLFMREVYPGIWTE